MTSDCLRKQAEEDRRLRLKERSHCGQSMSMWWLMSKVKHHVDTWNRVSGTELVCFFVCVLSCVLFGYMPEWMSAWCKTRASCVKRNVADAGLSHLWAQQFARPAERGVAAPLCPYCARVTESIALQQRPLAVEKCCRRYFDKSLSAPVPVWNTHNERSSWCCTTMFHRCTVCVCWL